MQPVRLCLILFPLLWMNAFAAQFDPRAAAITDSVMIDPDVWFAGLARFPHASPAPRVASLRPKLKPQYKISSQLASLQPKLKRQLSAQYKTQKLVSTAKPKIVARYSSQGTASGLGASENRVYQYQNEAGGAVFSDRAPTGINYQILLFDCFACRPDSNLDWYKIPLYTLDYISTVMLAAREFRLDPALIRAVIHAESAFDAQARSKAGAMGLMQLMPGTAEDMGVKNAFNAQQNILGGSRYLAQMLKQFNGDVELACAAYNAGPSVVTQYRGIPPYPETQAYVKRVKILLKRYRAAMAS